MGAVGFDKLAWVGLPFALLADSDKAVAKRSG